VVTLFIKTLKTFIAFYLQILFLPFLILLSLISRSIKKTVDIGLGPHPLINNIYHKRALLAYGYKAETFVQEVYFITEDFDIRGDKWLNGKLRFFLSYALFIWSIFRYKCLYLYFNGGSLGGTPLAEFEPYLYKLAGIKVVVMPYGADVQDLTRTPNLFFRHTMSIDYPNYRLMQVQIANQVSRWTKNADYVISGCDWVDYMYHWNRLMLGHFSIDTSYWSPSCSDQENQHKDVNKLKILHAPNHRNVKGTQFFIDAINSLKEDGYNIELVILERVPNYQVKEVIASVDIVADQLVVGWYAMFALEAMSMGKPVICYLRDDLESLYTQAGLITENEVPIINSNPLKIKSTIEQVYKERHLLVDIGQKSREFVIKHHSIDSIGRILSEINQTIGLNHI